MKYYITFFLVLFFSTSIALAQTSTDYYINQNGNRVEGDIRLRVVEAIPQFLFSNPSNGQETELFPENVKELKIGKKIYISRRVQYAQNSTAVDDVFLERIIQGPVSYYYNKYTEIKYFFEKNGVTKSLYREKVENNLSTGIDSFYINKFLDVFYEYFGDCSQFEYTKRYKLSKNSLIEYVDDYNECVDPSYVRLKTTKTEFFIEVGVNIGYSNATFNATTEVFGERRRFDISNANDVIIDVSILTNIYKEKLLLGLKYTSINSEYKVNSGGISTEDSFTTEYSFLRLHLAYRIPIRKGFEFRPMLGGVVQFINNTDGGARALFDNGQGSQFSRSISARNNFPGTTAKFLGMFGGTFVYKLNETFNATFTGEFFTRNEIPGVTPVGSGSKITQNFFIPSFGIVYRLKL